MTAVLGDHVAGFSRLDLHCYTVYLARGSLTCGNVALVEAVLDMPPIPQPTDRLFGDHEKGLILTKAPG